MDLDDAWSSDAFTSSAAHVKDEADKYAKEKSAEAAEKADKVKEAAPAVEVLPRAVLSRLTNPAILAS
jgi:hypothetical protein